MTDKETIDKLEHNIAELVSHVEILIDNVGILDEECLDLSKRMDTMERNHRFMSYKLPDSLKEYYGHKLLPTLDSDDLKEDEIKHEASKYEDVDDDDKLKGED